MPKQSFYPRKFTILCLAGSVFLTVAGCQCPFTKEQVANPFADQEIIVPPATRGNLDPAGLGTPPEVLTPYEDGTVPANPPAMPQAATIHPESSAPDTPPTALPYGSISQTESPGAIYLSQDASTKTIPSVYRTTSLMQSGEGTTLSTSVTSSARQRTTVD